MEELLNTIAVLIPDTGKTATGRAERSKFIRTVFTSPAYDALGKGKPFLSLLGKVSNKDWDTILVKIIDQFAGFDIS